MPEADGGTIRDRFDAISPLDYRFYGGDPEMYAALHAFLSEDAAVSSRARAEAALAKALAAEGLCREEDAMAIADACARLPQGMVSITVLLVAAEHASMAVAGLVVAGYTLGQAVTGPVRGRLADRHGLVTVAACCGAGYALALLALLAGAMNGAPAGLLTGAATAAGLVNPPLSPGLRSLWSARAGARFAQTAFGLDAAVFDLAYITGPVLAGALATDLAPAAALGLMLALTGAAAAPGGSGTETQDRKSVV